MKYPTGQVVKIGDHIWWNGGKCVGYVQLVIASSEELKRWGISSPSIMIGNHPFSSESAGFVCVSEGDFIDDGIGPLDEVEERSFDRARTVAIENTENGADDFEYSVTTEVVDFTLTAWCFESVGTYNGLKIRVPEQPPFNCEG